MLTSIIILILGLLLLVKGAEILITTAIAIGKKLKISEFFIGLIVVGFGTSLCELVVSIEAVLKGSPDLSVGNVIGSNIANLLLVLFAAGITTELKAIKVSFFDLSFHLGIHLLFLVIFTLSFLDKTFGIIFLLLFIFYLFKCFKSANTENIEQIKLENDFFSKISFKNPLKFGIPISILSVSLILFGAEMTVDSAIVISRILGVSDSFIGLTIIALGTSLPEVATSITAAKKGKSNIIIGNIIGSNIYNLLLILGFASLFDNFSYNRDILSKDVVFLVSSVLLFTFLIYKEIKIGKIISIFCLLIYIIFLSSLYFSNF